MLVSIVLPVYNQADHIEKVLLGYLERLNEIGHPFELLVVVNGSHDNSLSICQSISMKYATVKTFEAKKPGWGSAVRFGLAAAKGDILCYANSARTTTDNLILLILYALAYKNTVVKANRKLRKNVLRRLGSLLYNIESRFLFNLPYWDINGTPKIFPRSYKHLLEMQCEDDLIDLEFHVICRRMNYPVVEVPLISAERFGGKSTTKFPTAVRLLGGALLHKKKFDALPHAP